MGRVIRGLRSRFQTYDESAQLTHVSNVANARVNAFDDLDRNPGWHRGPSSSSNGGGGNFYRQIFSDKSMIASIYNRIAVDCALVEIYHAILDPLQDTPLEVVRDTLNERLTLEANIDQSAFAFKMDQVLTMFRCGDVAVCPIDTDASVNDTSSFQIGSMRCGPVVTYFPRSVTVNLWDDREVDSQGRPVNGGVRKDLHFPKEAVAIIQNPFYAVMNEPNGLLQRLLRKLEILDGLDEAVGSGKLDIIMQLPYAVRGAKRDEQAKVRREMLREQLKDDELGIGYIDITEKVIQLNRPVDNKLLDQIETLFKKVMDELGMTPEILNGTASVDALNAYYDRVVEPVMSSIALEYKRKFLTKNARTRRHSIEIFRDPFKLIPIAELANIMDAFLRNAAGTANELRPKIGLFPSKDPRANELANPNMPVKDQIGTPQTTSGKEETNDGPPVDAEGVEQ